MLSNWLNECFSNQIMTKRQSRDRFIRLKFIFAKLLNYLSTPLKKLPQFQIANQKSGSKNNVWHFFKTIELPYAYS